MVADIDRHVIGITESWANEDRVDAELALTGYVMFMKDKRERRGGGVILYIKEYVQAYEITLKSEADSEEAIWCNIVTRNSTLVVYRSPNIGQEEDVILQKAIREVSKGECVIMGDFNHDHIQWESLESAGGDDHQFLLLTQDCLLNQHVLEPTRGGNVLILSSQNELVDNVKVHEPLGSSDHNQIHFNIKVKTGNTYKKTMEEELQ